MSILYKRRIFINIITQLIHKNTFRNTRVITTCACRLPQPNFLPCYQPNLEILRHKSKASKKKAQVEASDEEQSDEEVQDEFDSQVIDKHTKVVTAKVNTLRMDAVLKSTLSVARSKIEEMFYESRIRLNGRKVLKKSDPVNVGDEIDVIKGTDVNNPKFLTVARVEILEVKPKGDGLSVKARRCKHLVIENYEVHPWESGS